MKHWLPIACGMALLGCSSPQTSPTAAAELSSDDLAQLTERVDDLEEKVSTLEEEKTDLESQLADAETKANDLESKQSDLEGDIDDIRLKVGY